jgi:hypothetical protein
MSRAPNAFIIPSAVILGLAFQKSFDIIGHFVKHSSKYHSQFYYLNLVAYGLIMISVVFNSLIIDFLNSPYRVQNAPALIAIWQLLVGIGNNVSSGILLYVLYARLYVFYKKETWIAKVMAVLVLGTFVARMVTFVTMIILRMDVISGRYLTQDASPIFIQQSLWTIIANSLESVCYIPSSILFLYHISNKVSLKANQFYSVLMKQGSVDYMLLIAVRMYTLIVGIIGVLRGTHDNMTMVVVRNQNLRSNPSVV